MYPFDLEEFLWAVGNDMMTDFIRDCYEKKRPLGQALHRRAMDYFRQFMIVGGMPQAIEATQAVFLLQFLPPGYRLPYGDRFSDLQK